MRENRGRSDRGFEAEARRGVTRERERGGLSAISFVDTNWALCSHSMEAWNAARGMVGRKGRGKEGLPACILFIVSLISRERCLDEVLGLGFR